MNKLTEWLTKPFLDENVDLPINIGDTVKMGKFKNKKVVVKKIDWNEKGDLLINGRPALKFRIIPKTNLFDKEEVTEGVEDPGIFKAVFLAGGPGSGKTFAARNLFGMPDSVNISMTGMKMVNSDKELKYLLNKYGFGTDLDKMPDEVFKDLTAPGKSGLRQYSKELTAQRLKLYTAGRLGVIVDGTGHKWKNIRRDKLALEKLGYDTYMIFVNTSLEVAQKRNQERDRILPPKLLEKSWRDVQNNRGAFKSIFKNNFIEVENSATLNDKQIEKKFGSLARKYTNVFMKRPIKNKIAKSWIKKQQILKKSGIKEFGIPSPSRKAVEKNKTDKKSGYTDIKEFINKPKMKKALQKLVNKKVLPKNYATNTAKLQQFLTNNPVIMTQLLRLLGENINEQKEIKKVVGIYGGRFQPFGPHHKKTYEWLKKQVDDVYITTSDIKRPPRHPMNFREKVRHMVKMGIPKNRIIKEKIPFVAKNVLKKYDKDTTAVIYVFGAKDAGRLSGGKYFQDYKKNKNNMNGYEDNGYVLTAPHVSVSVGGKEVSGTVMRQLLGSPDYEKNREKLFKKAFGYFDKGIYSMMTNKFKKLFESIDEFLIKNDISKLIKEESTTLTSPTDDGPPTFYKGFSDYKKFSKIWIDDMYAGAGWEVLQYILGKHAINPDFDYTLKYNVVPAVAYGRKQSGDYGTRFGVNDPINTYKDYIEGTVLRNLGYKVLKWMGITPDGKNYTGVEVETPVLPGVGKDNVGNTEEDKLDLKERINLDEEVKLILEDDTVKYKKPNFEFEWDEAKRYPEFVEMGKDGWMELAKKGYTTKYSKIKDILGNVDLNFDGLEKEKKARFQSAYENGTIEIPTVVKFSDKDYDLIGGNTRLSGLVSNGENPTLWVVDISNLKELAEGLLLEGGAYGHMNHPFDDKNITFSDLKQIVINGLGGTLNREDGVTEKLDGQNLMVSWVNGKLVTARNKGQLKNFGSSAMDIKGVASKFSGRGDIKDAFVFAMKDLNKSIGSLSDKQKEKIFGNGKRWMNLEVMYPKSANVIDYDKAQIVFHGTLEYDDSGTAIGQPKDSARVLAGMIKQVNQSVQKHYTIGKPQFLSVPKVQDFGKKEKMYLGKLNKLQNQFKLKDNDTLAKYHQSFWEEFIFNASKQHKYKISNKVLVNLTKRWAFFDKSYKIPTIKKDIKNKKFLDWVLSFDKNDHSKWVKQNMKPFEVLFFDVGAEILKNISGYLAASPDKAVQKIRKDVISAIKTVKSGGDIKKIQTLKLQLDKLNKIGGLSAIVPSEGIVFKYKGKTYKFTGAFAPVNQILGLLNF